MKATAFQLIQKIEEGAFWHFSQSSVFKQQRILARRRVNFSAEKATIEFVRPDPRPDHDDFAIGEIDLQSLVSKSRKTAFKCRLRRMPNDELERFFIIIPDHSYVAESSLKILGIMKKLWDRDMDAYALAEEDIKAIEELTDDDGAPTMSMSSCDADKPELTDEQLDSMSAEEIAAYYGEEGAVEASAPASDAPAVDLSDTDKPLEMTPDQIMASMGGGPQASASEAPAVDLSDTDKPLEMTPDQIMASMGGGPQASAPAPEKAEEKASADMPIDTKPEDILAQLGAQPPVTSDDGPADSAEKGAPDSDLSPDEIMAKMAEEGGSEEDEKPSGEDKEDGMSAEDILSQIEEKQEEPDAAKHDTTKELSAEEIMAQMNKSEDGGEAEGKEQSDSE